MSGRKKSALGVALEYSLHIGRASTDTVKTGAWEAGLSGKGRAASVQKIDDDYAVLAKRLKTVEEAFAGLSKTAMAELRDQVEALGTAAQQIETREVTNDEDARKAMLDLIAEHTLGADDVLDAIRRAKLPAPKIGGPGSIHVFVNEPVTLVKLGAVTDDEVVLSMLGPDNAPAEQVRFPEAGRQTVTVVSAATDAFRQGRRPVLVVVNLRPRVVTCDPLPPIVWGKVLVLGDLKAKATGKGDALALRTDTSELAVGEREVVLEAKGDGKAWGDGQLAVKLTVNRATRSIDWTLPAEVSVGQEITPELLGATVVTRVGRTRIELPDAIDVVLPAGGAYAKPGNLAVKLEAPQTATYERAERSGTLTVVKGVPELAWPTPPSAVVGDKLGPAHMAITVEPPALRKSLVFVPAAKTPLAAPGLIILQASFAGSDAYEAATCSTRLLVVASTELARGVDAAHDGSAFAAPADKASKDRVKDWNDSDEDDPEALGTMGPALMAQVSQMTAPELIAFMTAHKDDANVSTFVNQVGKKILSFKNGLEIRYKPNGSLKSGGKPILCMEVRRDPAAAVSTGQGDIAFKVTATGKPAPKGPAGVKRPADVQKWGGPQKDSFDDGVMAATHLAIKT